MTCSKVDYNYMLFFSNIISFRMFGKIWSSNCWMEIFLASYGFFPFLADDGRRKVDDVGYSYDFDQNYIRSFLLCVTCIIFADLYL